MNLYKVCRHSDGSIWQAGHTVYGLCSAYNHATDPGDYRNEHEHNRMNQYARAINNRMKRIGLVYGKHYRELSNGMYWPSNLNNIK